MKFTWTTAPCVMNMKNMTHTNTASPPFLRFGEVCDLLGMSRDSGYAHHRQGTFPIPVVTVGSILKCRTADVMAFINGTSDGGAG